MRKGVNMSLSNPNKPVTEARLAEFFNRLKSYLGYPVMPSEDMGAVIDPLPSVSHGANNPTGTIISFMGNYAPDGYLICDGSTYNIADYPRLANFFLAQFDSINKFGGDGTTTFAVPDLRGEFLRGTGTNSHTNQGSGSYVGAHQDATQHLRIGGGSTNDLYMYPNNTEWMNEAIADSYTTKETNNIRRATLTNNGTQNNASYYMSRPTNTSVLYCIKD